MNGERKGPSSMDSMELHIYIDGASRGNPGRAGAGVYVTDREGNRMAGISQYLGHRTNNEAEYEALLLGLKVAKRLEGKALHFYTDSELVQRQMKGIYRVRDQDLKVLHKKAVDHLQEFSFFDIKAISRKENQEADQLANQAIDQRVAMEKKKEGAGGGRDGRSPSRPEKGGDWGEESPSSTG